MIVMKMMFFALMTTTCLGQKVEFPFKNPTHYTIQLEPGFVDSLYQNVKEALIIHLQKNLNNLIVESHFCFEKELTDSIYATSISESNLHHKLFIKHDSIPDSLILNPVWETYDPSRRIPMYRYISYQVLDQPSIVNVKNDTKEAECLATITFSKLYEHEDFLLGEIFLEWKKVNMDIQKVSSSMF